MHIGANNKLYTYNMNNETLKTVDVEREREIWELLLIRIKNIRNCLMAAKKQIVF